MAAYKSSTKNVDGLIQHLKKHGKDRSWSELTKMFFPKGNDDWSRSVARLKGFDVKTGDFTVQARVENTKSKSQNQRFQSESNQYIKRIIELEKDIDLLSRVKEYTPEKFIITAPNKNKKHEATAIFQWSDWHVDEVVESKTVNGLNEYNKHIAKQRAFKLFENCVKVANTQRQGVTIKTAIIQLGGDAIGAYIHPELQQTNSMSPLEGIFYAKELTIAGLEYVLENGGFEQIIVITNRGNHPRLTPKMQYANDYSMNLETFLFVSLADYFKNEKKISFKIEQSELNYITVYDRVLRFFHGHQIKSSGGIGGLTIPLYKQIHRWNDTNPAYYNFMCDKHVYSNPTPDCQVNGSLKGYDAYAISHGFKMQPPIQSFTLLDSKYGITIKAPVFC